jgi:cytidine deaminase
MHSSKKEDYPMPCGACRQKIYEFSIGDTPIIGAKLNFEDKIWQIDQTSIDYILPKAFGKQNL